MNWSYWLPLITIASSFIPGMIIFTLAEESVRLRSTLNLLGAVAKLIFVSIMLWQVYNGAQFETRLDLLPGIELVLRADPLALLFATLSTVLWLLTTIYAIGYLEGSPHRSRFFGFFSLCTSATVGVALAGNLLTFIIFYELLTLSTYPLVAHRGTEAARRAGQTYLVYTISGGALLLLGAAWLYSITGTVEFVPQGFVAEFAPTHGPALVGIFILLVTGLGVKAALVPLHGWLPKAMVAPAPVSALLHAVAVVKAGAFGIIRVIYEVFGAEFGAELGVTQPLSWLAAVTIIYGSLRALVQTDLKRRLAYSTVSQVSYVVLGIAIAGPVVTIGGLVHLVHQGVMKITLFFCAGNLAETLGIHSIKELDGAGKRMPWTMAAFTVAAFGMIGLPPIAGFVSKWYLATGALQAEQSWVVWVLVASTLLNASYFLPLLHRAWFCPAPKKWPHERQYGGRETAPSLLWPPVITALIALAAGLFASTPFSPLEWALFIAQREFYQP